MTVGGLGALRYDLVIGVLYYNTRARLKGQKGIQLITFSINNSKV